MEPENYSSTICCLPDEIIVMILQHNECQDVLHFSMTCKRYYELVKNNNVLWKNIYRKTLPEMLDTIRQYGSGDWYGEVREYYKVKKEIYTGLSEAAIIYYVKTKTVHFVDVCYLMNVMAFSKNQNYYYTVSILQDMMKKTSRILNTNTSSPPYTLTEMYYAKTALRYYFHAYLAVKWVIYNMKQEKPTPLKVINFFVQWIYNKDLEADELADLKITELADKVDDYLKTKSKGVSVKDASVRRQHNISEEQVIAAVSHVMYKQRHIVSGTETADYDTLDVTKVLKNKCGHHIVLLAIYQAVALKFGVYCELYVFPNHLYLEWRSNWNDPRSRGYIVDVHTGTLKPKGGCPFSRGDINSSFRYDHYTLIECLYMECHRTMGYINDWNTENGVFLTDLMRMNDNEDSAYRILPSQLYKHPDFQAAVATPMEFKFLSNVHLNVLKVAFTFNVSPRPADREKKINRHPSYVKFAVGMICTHTQTHFKCVILGWDNVACDAQNIERTTPQTRYFVIDIDKSTRYVAQEYLIDEKRPSRLTHLEDALAPEFSHFDGYRYVPNESKISEYPDDDAIAMMYKTKAGMYVVRSNSS